MRYDENTGNMVDDDQFPASTPCWNEGMPVQDLPPGETDAHGKIPTSGALALAFVLGISFSQLGWFDKLFEVFWGDTPKEAPIVESVPGESAEDMRSHRLIVTCCQCQAEFDATEFQHLETFDYYCPRCGTHLQVESR